MSPTAPARRIRRTVVLSAVATEALLQEALAGVPRAGIEPRRQQLLGLLQAFIEAARPAGGLALDSQGQALHRTHIEAEGARLAEDGVAAEALWAKLKRGQAMDLRLALGVLHFFRHVLGRPALELDALGAVDGERHAALRRLSQAVAAARDDVPAEILSAFVARADEAAQTPVALAGYVRRYADFRLSTDDDGVMRMRLVQTNRYRPVRLVPQAAFHPLRLAAEWHQWSRTPEVELVLRELDSALVPKAQWVLPVQRLMRNGLVLVEAVAAAVADALALPAGPGLEAALPLSDSAGRDRLWEVQWRLGMVFNAADRDILVNYAPIVRPEIEIDAGASREVLVQVGDSPGLVRTPRGWRLDRTLLPREVLAIRLRSKSLGDADARLLSPTGEFRPGLCSGRSAAD